MCLMFPLGSFKSNIISRFNVWPKNTRFIFNLVRRNFSKSLSLSSKYAFSTRIYLPLAKEEIIFAVSNLKLIFFLRAFRVDRAIFLASLVLVCCAFSPSRSAVSFVILIFIAALLGSFHFFALYFFSCFFISSFFFFIFFSLFSKILSSFFTSVSAFSILEITFFLSLSI